MHSSNNLFFRNSHLEDSAKDGSVHPSYGYTIFVAVVGFGIPFGAAITPFNIAAGVSQHLIRLYAEKKMCV